MTSDVQTTVTAELEKLEHERCRALSEKDWPALDALLSADYRHVHTTGRVEDKPVYLEGMKERPRETSRSDISVRVYGDAAVMMGRQTNKTERGGQTEQMHSMVTQVWVRQGKGWKLVSAQNTRLP